MNRKIHLKQHAFTLVELLAAMTVLAILGAIVTQMISSTNQAIRVSNRQIDAASQARLAFARLERDLRQILARDDTDLWLDNPGPLSGNDSMLFISSVSSEFNLPANNRGLSVLAYRVEGHRDSPGKGGSPMLCLQRAAVPLLWTDTGFMGLDINGAPVDIQGPGFSFAPQGNASAPQDYDILAEGVFRMWVGYQLLPSGQTVTLSDGRTPIARGQLVDSPPVKTITPAAGPPGTDYIDLSKVASLIVAVAATDIESRRLLTASEMDDIADDFLDPPRNSDGSVNPPLQDNGGTAGWSSIAEDTGGFTNSIPSPALRSIRVYQRAFLINPAWSKSL